jgi:hypothetical protein
MSYLASIANEFEKMRAASLLVLTLSSGAFAQQLEKLPMNSPDKKFHLGVTTKDVADSNTEWKYWLIKDESDSVLLTTSILHDMPAPVAYWNKTSTKLIYEEQTHETNEIRIYDLVKRKIILQTQGFIWGHSIEYFDQVHGELFFFRKPDGIEPGTFELMILNVETMAVKSIQSIKTSGDPVTGAPEIESLDGLRRQLVLTFESVNHQTEKISISY